MIVLVFRLLRVSKIMHGCGRRPGIRYEVASPLGGAAIIVDLNGSGKRRFWLRRDRDLVAARGPRSPLCNQLLPASIVTQFEIKSAELGCRAWDYCVGLLFEFFGLFSSPVYEYGDQAAKRA